jgi:lipoprotein-anchoring transpeptidase ErfK/SrfK
MTFLQVPWLRSAFAAVALFVAAAQPVFAGQVVPFRSGYQDGSIVIVTHRRELYYVLGNGRAIRYPVGVGKAGMAWHGHAWVERKLVQPAWRAPPSLNGGRYGPVIPGGHPRNPMGAAVLGLDRGNYAIHGTNNPASVGRFVSHGCIRMYNGDIVDLYRRVHVGTDVYVLR